MNSSAVKVYEEMQAKGIFPSSCVLCNGDCAHCSVAREALHPYMQNPQAQCSKKR